MLKGRLRLGSLTADYGWGNLATSCRQIGMAGYQLHSKLPAELKGKLPSAKPPGSFGEVVCDRSALPSRCRFSRTGCPIFMKPCTLEQFRLKIYQC